MSESTARIILDLPTCGVSRKIDTKESCHAIANNNLVTIRCGVLDWDAKRTSYQIRSIAPGYGGGSEFPEFPSFVQYPNLTADGYLAGLAQT